MREKQSDNKVAMITGAARRIGAEIARTLHAAGVNVVLHYNASEEAAMALRDDLNRQRPHSAIALRADLLLPESAEFLIDQTIKSWNRLDILINNASRYYRTLMNKVTEYAWDDLMNCNLKAPFFLAQAAAPHLKKVSGTIINITDIRSDRPLDEYAVYSISKAGLTMATKVLAKELAPEVRVNAIAPGPIIWPEGQNALSDGQKEKVIASTLLHKHGHPRDIAKAVLFFARDADFITGQILYVDGGRALAGIGG